MGLRRVALELGVEIFENSQVQSFSRSDPVEIKTSSGKLRAKVLVIASNAWAASIKELSRSIVAITSDMIVTAPAREELERSGWSGGEGITDSQTMVDYYQVTKDHRVAFGKGGWGIALGGLLGKDFDSNPIRAKTVESDFRRYYPLLSKVEVTHHWCGPIDRTPNSLPLLGRFRNHPNIIYGVGWSGNGVGPSRLGGKILSSLALNLNDEWGTYPLVGKSVGLFPPEPIRFIGAHVVRGAVARKERREIQNLHPHLFDVQISKLAPAGLEDK
jgi:glycine/D-amino acid oxidase-like deaminating enzyme